jgi:hypothetical protein
MSVGTTTHVQCKQWVIGSTLCCILYPAVHTQGVVDGQRAEEEDDVRVLLVVETVALVDIVGVVDNVEVTGDVRRAAVLLCGAKVTPSVLGAKLHTQSKQPVTMLNTRPEIYPGGQQFGGRGRQVVVVEVDEEEEGVDVLNVVVDVVKVEVCV